MDNETAIEWVNSQISWLLRADADMMNANITDDELIALRQRLRDEGFALYNTLLQAQAKLSH